MTSHQDTHRSIAHARSLLGFAICYEDRAVEVDEDSPTRIRAALPSEHDSVVADIAMEEVVHIVEYLMHCDVRKRLYSDRKQEILPSTTSRKATRNSSLDAKSASGRAHG